MGRWLLGTVPAAVSIYAARQADARLHRHAARLALDLGQIRSVKCVDWLASQDIPPDVRRRLSLEEDALVVHGCRRDVDPEAPAPLRFAIAAL